MPKWVSIQLKPLFLTSFFFFFFPYKILNRGVFGGKKKTPTFHEKTEISLKPSELNVETATQQ